jgi:hypothetical protein
VTGWYILAGIWTFLAFCWTMALLTGDAEGGKASKLERLIRSMEQIGQAYQDSQR